MMYFNHLPQYMLVKKDGFFVMFSGEEKLENFETFLKNNISNLTTAKETDL